MGGGRRLSGICPGEGDRGGREVRGRRKAEVVRSVNAAVEEICFAPIVGTYASSG